LFSVSYAMVNWQLPSSPGSFVNSSAFSMTALPSPSTAGIVMETHSPNADDGPYEGWGQFTSSSYYAGGLPMPGAFVGKWNLMGDSYGDKAENAAYADGHAKRINYSVRDCTAYNQGSAGGTQDFYDITGADLAASGNGYTWEATNCTTLPAAFK
jgi:hypothetical protein